MRKNTAITRLCLAAALCTGVWAIANAGPVAPPQGGVTPTPEALDVLNTKVNQIIEQMGSPPTDPENGLSAFISMIPGESPNERVILNEFTYEILSPFNPAPVTGGFTRTELGEVKISFDKLDSAFVPFLFSGLRGTPIAEMHIDLCTQAGVGQPMANQCVMSIEMFNVVVISADTGDTPDQSVYRLAAERIRTTYRRFNIQGMPIGTHVHAWDYVTQSPF